MSNGQLVLSETGARLIQSFERLVLTGYRDPTGHITIGWGHTGEAAVLGRRITVPQAEALFRADVAWAEAAVRQLMQVPLAQHEFDALVSLVFNIGRANFARSTARRRLNRGDRTGAAEAMRWWTRSTDQTTGERVMLAGLVRRRAWEVRLFQGDQDPSTAEFDRADARIPVESSVPDRVSDDPAIQTAGGTAVLAGGGLVVQLSGAMDRVQDLAAMPPGWLQGVLLALILGGLAVTMVRHFKRRGAR